MLVASFINKIIYINIFKLILLGKELLKFHAFANAVKICDAILKSYDISVTDIFTTMNATFNKSALHNFVGVIAFQVLYFYAKN